MTSRQPADPYRELGIDRTADQRSIRLAYHAKARATHPDLGGEAQVMARVNAAYDLLRDRTRRAAYDREQVSAPTAHDDPKKPPWTGAAGPPPGRPSGPKLEFGIFAGWSLGEIARRDPGYLVWLAERKEGRPYAEAIEAIVAPMREAARPIARPRRGA